MNDYEHLFNRLASFKEWPLNFPVALALANAGLFYTGRVDEVCCYKCHCYINDWKDYDSPVERHKLASPHCPIVLTDSWPILSEPAVTEPPIADFQPEEEENSEPVQPTSPQQENVPNPVSRHGGNIISSDSQSLHMKSEAVRLRTFVGWFQMHVLPEDLAKEGFFSMNIGDCVKCAFCSGILKQWVPGDIPFIEHKKYYPGCPFVCGLPVGNIPIKPAKGGLKEKKGGQKENSYKDSRQIPDSLLDASIFSDFSHRRSSFANHLHLLRIQNPDSFAVAGFYYVGPADTVKCFSCDGVLRNWSLEDDPWIEHAVWYPGCNFLLAIKGHDFVEAILRRKEQSRVMGQSSPPVVSIDLEKRQPEHIKDLTIQNPAEESEDATFLKQQYLSSSTSSLQLSASNVDAAVSSHSPGASSSPNLDKHLKIKDEDLTNATNSDDNQSDVLLCKICMDKMANTVFLPCVHLLCCEDCAPVILECPVCRGIINDTLKIYIP